MKKPPIPSNISVGPYVLYVKLVTHRELTKRLRLKPKDMIDGFWCNTLGETKRSWYRQEQAGIIYLNRNLSPRMLWRTLLHELQHAMIDLHDWDWEN